MARGSGLAPEGKASGQPAPSPAYPRGVPTHLTISKEIPAQEGEGVRSAPAAPSPVDPECFEIQRPMTARGDGSSIQAKAFPF